MFAVIKTGGKQYKVSEKDIIVVEKLDKKEGEEIIFEEVLLFDDGKETKIGKPLLEKASVKGKVLEEGKGEKQIIFKYKPKKRYKVKKGHRQPFSKVQIESISV